MTYFLFYMHCIILSGKRLLGYWPKVEFCVDLVDSATMPNKTSALLRRLYQWTLKQVLDNINSYKNGFTVTLFNGEVKWLVPVFAMMKTDWPEGQQVCNMKRGATVSKRVCRVCLCPTDEFANTEKGCGYHRRTSAQTGNFIKYWRCS